MLGKAALLGVGVVIGIAVDRVALELAKPAPEQFPTLRHVMNERINPWLLERGYPGSEHAEIGTLEHTGRRSGSLHLTPVHPTLREATARFQRSMIDAALAASAGNLSAAARSLELDRSNLLRLRARLRSR